jgi:DNA adenine methylase
MRMLPQEFNRYYEPFLGGGALFFAVQPAGAVLSDSNTELIECYRQLRDEPEMVGAALQTMSHDEESYYSIRARGALSGADAAARLIYLTTLAFNGIYRVNADGEFNVPYGDRPYPGLGSPSQLEAYSAALKGSELVADDFEHVLNRAQAEDLVYLDPPYTVAHSNNAFLKYNGRIFSWTDQKRLADVAQALHQRGCYVIISNAYHESIAALYPGFDAHLVSRSSVMAADRAKRKPIQEYVFTNQRVG